MSDLPDKKWQAVSVDFSGPYPSGDYCFVVIDEYSRFPVVELVKSTSAKCVIPVLDKIFATHGIPEILKSDNGPPFQSYEFRRFMEYCGIHHRRITPFWPRANAQAENFIKTLSKAVKTATVEGKSWKQELYKFLRNYRATPHVTTGKAPAELLFESNIRVLLPEIITPTDDRELRHRDKTQKEKQKRYADKKNCRKPITFLRVGDMVLLKQVKKNKLSSAYHPQPMSVIQVKGSMITARNQTLGAKTRNASHFVKIIDADFTADAADTEETDLDFTTTSASASAPDYVPVSAPNCVSVSAPDSVSVSAPDSASVSAPDYVSPSAQSSPSVRPQRVKSAPVKFKDYHM